MDRWSHTVERCIREVCRKYRREMIEQAGHAGTCRQMDVAERTTGYAVGGAGRRDAAEWAQDKMDAWGL